ncbi:transcriptional regulator TbsP domain-containing protein [Halosegnis longus]|uniref:transcriptional regulator TbsP domain-containing protein n=1 Tax=Halosegnis longus TaxID=2216012 RepID=UPI0026973D6C
MPYSSQTHARRCKDVLAAAANDCSLYAVSGLLEDCGLASKATISRAKITLEDAGVITTTRIE